MKCVDACLSECLMEWITFFLQVENETNMKLFWKCLLKPGAVVRDRMQTLKYNLFSVQLTNEGGGYIHTPENNYQTIFQFNGLVFVKFKQICSFINNFCCIWYSIRRKRNCFDACWSGKNTIFEIKNHI